ncbi:hypothetical protein SKAU_G00418010 [Synaphobranchus kaupii]|uniref:IgGFc-binding protein N-terminal domain-containing protein n=1 Tax=Synaphobranchus kaupii TaxID=118154 RepID=A0A9Q1E6A7_SYNKA|nr:hypothetical protein SKAU_G00418010 [Synaphobranchus kaupii]
MIRSSKLITIVSSNQKKNSIDTSLVYPVTKLGQEYYVFTPSATGNSNCQHVFEQLLPVERWATHFFILPLEYQVLKDSVYVFASASTRVTGQFGEKSPFAIDLKAEGMEDFSNYALIVAKDIKKVQFDDKHPSFKWKPILRTEYSWTRFVYEKGRGHHTVKSPGAPIGVYSVGTVNKNSYGAPAACGRE